MKLFRLSAVILILFLASIVAGFADNKPNSTSSITQSDKTIIFNNDYLKYEISKNGLNLSFIDRKSGKQYCSKEKESFVAYVRKAGTLYNASEVSLQNQMLSVKFGESGVIAQIKPEVFKHYITFEVVSVSDENIDELIFVNIPLTLKATMDEPYGASALSVNLKTNVIEQPGLQSSLFAGCYPRFGVKGAKAAIIGCKPSLMRDTIKEIVLSSPDLPKSPKGGPWAWDEGSGKRSFVLMVYGIRLKEVDKWIEMCKNMGISGIDFHTGNGWLRFGDYLPYPEYPDAINELKQVIAKLHEAGIITTFHTYSFVIAADSPYVTPVPNPGLAKDKTLTLAETFDIDSNTLKVSENNKNISPHSMYGVANDQTIQIDDELITFTGVSNDEPFSFTGCVRGARGTKVSKHEKGAKVHVLKMVFGGYLPDIKSDLFIEMAKRHADIYNECNFDGFYFDAIDGAFVYGGWGDAWYYASNFVYEVEKRIKKPGIFDYSAPWHHFWYLRSRLGSADTSKRGHKEFIDMHALSNKTFYEKTFIPTTLGWNDIFTYGNSIYPERNFPDDIEYLGAKCLGNGSGFTLGAAFSPSRYESDPNLQRLGKILSRWEKLKLSKIVPESIKVKLREPGKDFTLDESSDKAYVIRPVDYAKHKMQPADAKSNTWTVDNRFKKQPAKLRIEPLAMAAEYDSPDSVMVADFAGPNDFPINSISSEVTAEFKNDTSQIKTGSASGYFSATSKHKNIADSSVMASKKLPSELDLSNSGFGVWVYGDGNGEIVNLQFKLYPYEGAGIDDYFVHVNFTGWKYFEFVEPESTPIEHCWNPGVYRKRAETLNIFYKNLPTDKKVECYISPIKALPLKVVKIKNPSITIGKNTITFPVEIEAGSYIEFISMNDCKVYDPQGKMVQELKPLGKVPILEKGENKIIFGHDGNQSNDRTRAKITVISIGEIITK